MAIDYLRDVLIEWEDAPRDAGVQVVKRSDLAAAAVDVRDGLWPGVRKPPNVDGRGDETVSASVEPWIDANGYLAACARTLSPGKTALIAAKPDSEDRVVPYDSLELALIEARVCGGNALLNPDKRFRDDWKGGKPQAQAAWKSLLATARWLREHEQLLGRPAIPAITMLVEPGNDESIELANLLFRRNGSPDLKTPATLPAPSPDRIAVVAAGMKVKAETASKLLAHARAGANVVTDEVSPDAWWRSAVGKPQRSQEDRDFFSVGKGFIVAYKQQVADPSEFALDVIDVVGHPRRAVRMWNASSVVPVGSKGILHAVNYGSPIDVDTQARLQGSYTRATLIAPGAQPVKLETYKRGTTTEVLIPSIRRLATILFE